MLKAEIEECNKTNTQQRIDNLLLKLVLQLISELETNSSTAVTTLYFIGQPPLLFSLDKAYSLTITFQFAIHILSIQSCRAPDCRGSYRSGGWIYSLTGRWGTYRYSECPDGKMITGAQALSLQSSGSGIDDVAGMCNCKRNRNKII